MTYVLAVDDDPAILRTLSINLRARDYEVETANDGRTALQLINERIPDVILLDLGLPDVDGVTVLTRVREFSHVPIIVVSARTEPDDKVEALDLGADDFITKPFSMDELMARIRVSTRRTMIDGPPLAFDFGGLVLDITESKAERDGEPIHLTPIEWKIVETLALKRGHLVRQGDLLQAVWGPGYDRQTNYLRVHMASIRRKLEKDAANPVLFVTEPGIGYRMV
jgi:two-component system KDP operon response regulator KdpE